jgi:hypothetical protein
MCVVDMAPLRHTAFFVCVLALADAQRPSNAEYKAAKEGEATKAASAAADQSKMGAVDKVVSMLEDLSQKVQAEGESEAKSYNEFACFCKTMQKKKEAAITEEKDRKTSLAADIAKLSDGRKEDDTTIANLAKDIKDIDDAVAKAQTENADALKKYNEEKADLVAAMDGITNAMKTLKATKPSLMQLKAATMSVQEYIAMADALGLGVDTTLLQQAPDVEMENYNFHSDGVIGTLEKLLKEFRGKKADSDSAEVKRLAEHDILMQQNTDVTKAKTLESEQTTKAKHSKTSDIATNSKALSTESAALLDDQQYLDNLYTNCKKKAESWDQRSRVRADELSAITAALTIVKGAVSEKTSKSTVRFAQQGVSIRLAQAVARDEDAMDSLEAAAEEKEAAPSAFLQRRVRHVAIDSAPAREAVDEISKLLRTVGGRTKSAMLTNLATQISTGAPKGLEKVKTLIEELISRLESEAAAEGTQHAWCVKAQATATTKQSTAAQDIDELNDELAKLEADRATLKTTLTEVAADIKELTEAQEKADGLRTKEKADNAATVTEAEAGQKAVEEAISILETFYKKAAEEKASFVQLAASEEPDTGAVGEVYKGSQSAATGVLGMLDVIKGDFVRTSKKTEQAETESQQDYDAFSAQTATSLKEKKAIQKARQQEKDDADASATAKTEDLAKETDLLVSTIEELLELKKACVDTGMTYEERVARREDEMDALNKALTILGDLAP